MSIKLADTLAPMADFPAAMAEHIEFDDGKSLQEKYDLGELGGEGGAGHIELTQAEYDALSDEEKNNGAIYFITDAIGEGGDASIDDNNISSESTWSSAKIVTEISDNYAIFEGVIGDNYYSTTIDEEDITNAPTTLYGGWTLDRVDTNLTEGSILSAYNNATKKRVLSLTEDIRIGEMYADSFSIYDDTMNNGGNPYKIVLLWNNNGTSGDENIKTITSLTELGLTADATLDDVITKLEVGQSATLTTTDFTNYQTLFPYSEEQDAYATVHIEKGYDINGSRTIVKWVRKDAAKLAYGGLSSNNKVAWWNEYALKSYVDSKVVAPVIKAAAGSNINTVGTPSVTANTSGNETTFTFNNLKGAKGDKGDKGDTGSAGTNGTTPTIKAAAGSNISTVGTPSVTASTSGTTTTFTFNNLKGAKGDTGANGTTPTIKASAGSNIGSVGTPKVSASTSGTTTTFTFDYLKGAKGSDGKNGNDGTRGSMWYSGVGITGTSTNAAVFSTSGVSSALVGDMYLNTTFQNVYRCTTAGNASTAKWVYVCCIKGAKGDTGTQYAITTSTAEENINREILVGTIDGHQVYQVTYKMGAQANSTGEKKSYKIGYPGNDVTMIEATGVINDGSVTFVVPFYKPDTGEYAYLGKYMSQMLVVSNMKTIKGALVTVRYIKNTDYLK
jgi:hypothetical protein